MLTRREWLAGTATTLGTWAMGSSLLRAADEARRAGLRVGMCDWSMGRTDPSAFELAKQIGLDGVEISLGTRANHLWLRTEEMQRKYRDAARAAGLAMISLGVTELNHIPLMSEPRAALWVDDAIDVAAALKIPTMLIPFFAQGELKEENVEDMRRVTEAVAELAPRAEKAGVTLGLESYLSAEAHLKIIDAVKSKAVKVYYDVKNATDAGHDPLKEIRQLGRDRICQIHFKDSPYLEKGSGKVDWPAVVAAIQEIRYDGWIVLETGAPSKDVVADTKQNLAYVKRLFGAAG